MNKKKVFNDRAFHTGAKLISRIYPASNWRNDYLRLKWWFFLSDQYESSIRPWFDNMLKQYKGKLWNRGRLIRLDQKLCWIFLGAEPDDYFSYEFFRKGWLWRNHHITKQRLNFFDPLLNRKDNAHILENKQEMYTHWNDWLKRRWCIPQEVTFEAFQSLFVDVNRLLVKPATSYGGKGIHSLDVNPDNLRSIYDQLHQAEDRIVVEEYVNQKGLLHSIYPDALNIMRVCTLRMDDTVEVLYAWLTTGCNGTFIANDCSGGITFPIETDTGRLGVGQGMSTNGHRTHPDTGVQVAGLVIPDWERVKAFACDAHRNAPEGLNLIGWDICLSDGELSVIEGNNSPGFPELPDRHDNQWKRMKQYLDRLPMTQQ